jgi:hypothetical protein
MVIGRTRATARRACLMHGDPLRVVGVITSDAKAAEIRSGFVGYLIGLAGGHVVEGTRVRCARSGVQSVSFPTSKKGYPYLWLRTRSARPDQEFRVFQKLGIRAEAAP